MPKPKQDNRTETDRQNPKRQAAPKGAHDDDFGAKLLRRKGRVSKEVDLDFDLAEALRQPSPAYQRRLVQMTQAATTVLTTDVPVEMAEKIDQLADRLDRPRAWIVKQALAAWIDLEEERDRLTWEALADVDAGRLIDHQAVQAWADSLGTDNPLPAPKLP